MKSIIEHSKKHTAHINCEKCKEIYRENDKLTQQKEEEEKEENKKTT